MQQELINTLLRGKFNSAYLNLNDNDFFPPEILEWCEHTRNISLYSLIASRLINKENIEDHQRSSYLLSTVLFIYEGAFSMALFHTRRVLALDPTNLEYKRFLLFFHDIPENLIKKEEAINLASEILNYDPSCLISIQILKQYGIIKES